MMSNYGKYKAIDVKHWDCTAEYKKGIWHPVRPTGIYSFWVRMALCIGVLTGKYDVLDWEDR
jgi:hypothetical protein